jgi:hypothetical protein
MDSPPSAATLEAMKRASTVVVVAALAAAFAAGCDGAGDCDTVEPVYAGAGTDETWRVMVEARASAKESDEVVVTVPAAGAVVQQGDDPPALAWDSDLEISLNEPASSTTTRPKPGFFDRLSATVFPVAHAHLPPITSDVYFLEIDVPGRTCPVSALTTLESMIFSDGDWEEVTKEPGERTLRLLSAFVTENRITEGPFQAAPVTFTVVE